MHTHGDDQGREHSHGGSAPGLGWDLLDSIVAGAAIACALLLGELAVKAWRERQARVRYDLTPEGLAAAQARQAPAATEPGCTHPLCKLEHPHAGPAILRTDNQ
jgi:hypothetical protein